METLGLETGRSSKKSFSKMTNKKTVDSILHLLGTTDVVFVGILEETVEDILQKKLDCPKLVVVGLERNLLEGVEDTAYYYSVYIRPQSFILI